MSFLDRYRESSEPLRTERRVELVCLGLGVLLALQVVWVLLRAVVPAGIEPVYPAESSLRVADIHSLNAVGQKESAEIRSRPLFWEGRRPQDSIPVEEDAPVEQKTKQGLPPVKLQGVFGSRGVIATVKGKQERLLVGDEVAGWTLKEIKPDLAIFESSGRREEVGLKRNVSVSVGSVEEVGPGPGPGPRPGPGVPAAPTGNSEAAPGKIPPEPPAKLGLGRM
ncbi:hypothetical protein FV139_16485 [Parahaliea maris]|uniref:Type II secretion system protein GspC N-terminal domain-containing protein n=1 Tax=Parahaliea maris TaxID=2716870 RepID=A0A5C8ZUR6_9GAMM|nr:hypothetical protein [Parahaliea maris]TXS91330.1 hypothetical protein FV139_16485 [Parahaliea maris]